MLLGPEQGGGLIYGLGLVEPGRGPKAVAMATYSPRQPPEGLAR